VPENRIEWGLFGLGLVVLALLGAVIAVNLGDDPVTGASAATAGETTAPETQSPPPTIAVAVATTAPAKPSPPAPRAAATPTVPSRTTAAPAPEPKPARPAKPAPQPDVRLRLSATRGDSWLEVRSGSSAGTVLFSGTLVRGTAKTFGASRLWIRFGGASNLDARLNGRKLGLRFGTYDTLVTPGGLAPPG